MYYIEWKKIETKIKEAFKGNIELSDFSASAEFPKLSGTKDNKGEVYGTYSDKDYDFDARFTMTAHIHDSLDEKAEIIKCLEELGYEIVSTEDSGCEITIVFKRTADLEKNKFYNILSEENHNGTTNFR